MIIDNLENHIIKDGEHAVFTGTFNPPHIGHTDAIRESLHRLPHLASVVVVPHLWNGRKNPIEIRTRVRWLIQTLGEFMPDFPTKIVVCHDPSILDKPDKFDDLCNTYPDKIHRILGSDKIPSKIRRRNHTKIVLTLGSHDNKRSTNIRDAIQKGNIDDIREVVAKLVLEDILANNYYGT